MEVAWLLSLKFLDIKAIRNISWNQLFTSIRPLETLIPLLAYLIFGLVNVIFFALASKSIPFATSFAVWMGTALIGSLLVDIFYFKESYSNYQLIFLMMIIIGIIGLKISN
jgi:quaternary ammonium compound-resistance protein SugE